MKVCLVVQTDYNILLLAVCACREGEWGCDANYLLVSAGLRSSTFYQPIPQYDYSYFMLFGAIQLIMNLSHFCRSCYTGL